MSGVVPGIWAPRCGLHTRPVRRSSSAGRGVHHLLDAAEPVLGIDGVVVGVKLRQVPLLPQAWAGAPDARPVVGVSRYVVRVSNDPASGHSGGERPLECRGGASDRTVEVDERRRMFAGTGECERLRRVGRRIRNRDPHVLLTDGGGGIDDREVARGVGGHGRPGAAVGRHLERAGVARDVRKRLCVAGSAAPSPGCGA